jgi:hypothetical protein
MGSACSTQQRDERFIEYFDWKAGGYISFRRPRCRWEDNIKIDLREAGWEDVHWMHLVQDRDQWQALVNMVKNLLVP